MFKNYLFDMYDGNVECISFKVGGAGSKIFDQRGSIHYFYMGYR